MPEIQTQSLVFRHFCEISEIRTHKSYGFRQVWISGVKISDIYRTYYLFLTNDLHFLGSRLITTLKKITNLKKLSVDDSVSKETFSEMVQSLVDWGNSASPVFAMVRPTHHRNSIQIQDD